MYQPIALGEGKTAVYVLSVVAELPMKAASTLLLRASGLFFGLVLYLLCLAAEIHFQRGGVL
jgi:hypothetical protein